MISRIFEKNQIPKLVIGEAAFNYMKKHGKKVGDDFFEVIEPLSVFKAMVGPLHGGGKCITNLRIPFGAHVYCPDYALRNQSSSSIYRKLRASEAYVVSSWQQEKRGSTRWIQVKHAVSSWDPKFIYQEFTRVKPTLKFSKEPYYCRSGIHFFLNLKDALEYYS